MADSELLEKQLISELKVAGTSEGKRMQAFDHAFNEVIKRDKNFGSLLIKIR